MRRVRTPHYVSLNQYALIGYNIQLEISNSKVETLPPGTKTDAQVYPEIQIPTRSDLMHSTVHMEAVDRPRKAAATSRCSTGNMCIALHCKVRHGSKFTRFVIKVTGSNMGCGRGSATLATPG